MVAACRKQGASVLRYAQDDKAQRNFFILRLGFACVRRTNASVAM
jgi:hypothetical protein